MSHRLAFWDYPWRPHKLYHHHRHWLWTVIKHFTSGFVNCKMLTFLTVRPVLYMYIFVLLLLFRVMCSPFLGGIYETLTLTSKSHLDNGPEIWRITCLPPTMCSARDNYVHAQTVGTYQEPGYEANYGDNHLIIIMNLQFHCNSDTAHVTYIYSTWYGL